MSDEFDFSLPNIRKNFIPDPGMYIADADLDRADAQVVAWEADDTILKQMFREKVDVHTENAKTIFGSCTGEGDPRRFKAKTGVHATNYKATASTVAAALGITKKEAEDFQAKWFSAHPGIPQWHERIQWQLESTREVRNKFGYRRHYFGRLDDHMLKEALAWVPQSTVANVINMGLINIHNSLPWIDILLQVHDSLVFQFPIGQLSERYKIRDCLNITVPYDDPLIIPVHMSVSKKSWGDVEAIDWG